MTFGTMGTLLVIYLHDLLNEGGTMGTLLVTYLHDLISEGGTMGTLLVIYLHDLTLEKNLNFLTQYSCRIDDCPLAFLTSSNFLKFRIGRSFLHHFLHMSWNFDDFQDRCWKLYRKVRPILYSGNSSFFPV